MRWTHLHTATVVLLALAFVGVSLMKHGVDWSSRAQTDTTAANVERMAAETFWQRYRQATQYRMAGRTDSAAATYRTALEKRPTHNDGLYYLGQVLYTQEKLQAARDAWQRLVAANPKSARAYTQIGEVHYCFPDHSLFDVDRARAAYQKALDLHNEETRPLLRLGTIALLRQDRSTARAQLEALRGANPNNPGAAILLGYLAWTEGASGRATVLFRKGQSRYEARDSTRTPACPLAEQIVTPLAEPRRRSSAGDASPYARLDSLFQEIRVDLKTVDS